MATISTGDNGQSVHDEDNQWERLGGKIEGLDLDSETYEEDKARALEQYEELLVAQKEINQRQSGIVVETEFQEMLKKQGRIISNLVAEVKRQKATGETQAELMQQLFGLVGSLKEVNEAQDKLMGQLLDHVENIARTVDTLVTQSEEVQGQHEVETEGFIEAVTGLNEQLTQLRDVQSRQLQRMDSLRDRVSTMEMAGGEPDEAEQPKAKKKDKTAKEIVEQEA